MKKQAISQKLHSLEERLTELSLDRFKQLEHKVNENRYRISRIEKKGLDSESVELNSLESPKVFFDIQF